MTMWLECCKKVHQHSVSIDWRQNHLQNVWTQTPIGPLSVHTQFIKMPQTPSRKAVPFPDIFWKYNAPLFQDTLANFIANVNNPGLRVHDLHTHVGNTLLPFCTVRVYHNMKFIAINDAQKWEIVDAVYVRPEQKDK